MNLPISSLDGHAVMDGGGDGCSLGAPELQHRLHVLAEEGCLDGHLVGQVTVDDAGDALEDVSEFQVTVSKLPQVDDTHRYHLRLAVLHLQQPVAHQVRSRVYAQYDFLHV